MRGRSPVAVSQPSVVRRVAAETAPSGPLTVPLSLAPYTNNGATPWYASLPLGTPGQTLRIALDTGSNFIWTTSTLCKEQKPPSCMHDGGGFFDYAQSSTFSWIEKKQIQVDFGPWGSMMVETGRDVVGLQPGGSPSLKLAMFLSASYSGPQFRQLEWDGGLGIPSGSAYADPAVSFFVAELMNAGLMDPSQPYISFQSNAGSGQGSVLLGGIDLDAVDLYSAVFLPWTPYTALAGVKYIWSTPLYLYAVGDTPVARNVQFCLDSGSSQFKGDDDIMNTTLSMVGASPQPDVTLFLGITGDGGPAQIVVPPSVYMVDIQAGPQAGQTLPQFNPLGLTDLVLVGSVLMDQLYTVFEYDVTETPNGYYLDPVGMWIFNRKDGPQIIRTVSAAQFAPRRRAPHGIEGGER